LFAICASLKLLRKALFSVGQVGVIFTTDDFGVGLAMLIVDIYLSVLSLAFTIGKTSPLYFMRTLTGQEVLSSPAGELKSSASALIRDQNGERMEALVFRHTTVHTTVDL
jgi:hypothetical protein